MSVREVVLHYGTLVIMIFCVVVLLVGLAAQAKQRRLNGIKPQRTEAEQKKLEDLSEFVRRKEAERLAAKHRIRAQWTHPDHGYSPGHRADNVFPMPPPPKSRKPKPVVTEPRHSSSQVEPPLADQILTFGHFSHRVVSGGGGYGGSSPLPSDSHGSGPSSDSSSGGGGD